jgi:DNA-binding beta-propeller fold protein YncE
MKYLALSVVALAAAAVLAPAKAEILAMVLYETKAEDSLQSLKLGGGPGARREGIAILDVDPESETFGAWLADYPLPPTLVSHHIYYNNDRSKAYVTALGDSLFHVLDMTRVPYRLKAIEVPACKVSENIVFSADGARFYMTCLESQNLLVGDPATALPIDYIDLPEPYPHGIAIHEGIDRMLVTSTNSTDMSYLGETFTAFEFSTLKPLNSYKTSNEPSPSGAAPAAILFRDKADPPFAVVKNWAAGTAWIAIWDPVAEDFAVQQIFDFAEIGHEFNVESAFNMAGDRLYMATAQPGAFHIFDIADPLNPVLIKTLPAASGAHHLAITADERYAFVQNGLINFPGMNDGSVTVIDLRTEQVVASVDTLKDAGLSTNDIILLPPWYRPLGG